MTDLRRHLEALYRDVDAAERLSADPIAFPRRYARKEDQEIAGLVAASLAFGRVDLFRPVLQKVFAEADRHGGPRAFVDAFDPDVGGEALRPLIYRWNRGVDFVLLFAVLKRVVARPGGLEGLFAWRRGEDDTGALLGRGIAVLRDEAVAVARDVGLSATSFDELPRGFRYFLPTPEDGSACKRWCMYLRWMARPATEGVDLGAWTSIPTRALVVPLDTHVARIARFVGLTARTDGSWRTALEVTRGLRALDPEDPIRFDFAIAHLGISGACKGAWDADTCPTCPLVEVCVEGTERGHEEREETRRSTKVRP